jgi:hypothetical protein
VSARDAFFPIGPDDGHHAACTGHHCIDCGACLTVKPPWWCRVPRCPECHDEQRTKNTPHGAAR